MKAVFADSLYWVALASPRDQWHEAARRANRKLGRVRLITTDEVLTEFLNSMSRLGALFRDKAIETVQRMLNNPNVQVLPQTREGFLRAMDLYSQRRDKKYSLVDCASMNAMRSEGLREVLTHDHHFAQEGFIVLIKKDA